MHGLQYQKIMPLQLANKSVLHICILSHCLKKASSTPASYVHSVLILLVECLIPYLVLLGMIFSTMLLSNRMDLFLRQRVIHQFSRPKNKEGKKGFPGLTTKKNRKVGTRPVIRRKGRNSGIQSKKKSGKWSWTTQGKIGGTK